MLEAKTASVFAQMVRNTRYPWRIASQHLYNNNNNSSVIYSLEELRIRHRGSHKHVCLRESRNKRRYILNWYEQGKKNPDKGIFISMETHTAAPRVPSSVWKGVASCVWLWGLCSLGGWSGAPVGTEGAKTIALAYTWEPIPHGLTTYTTKSFSDLKAS